MDELKRYLRYTLPGFAVILAFIIALYLTNRETILPLMESKNNIAILLGLFLTSGALGFLFSHIYFVFYWCESLPISLDFKKEIENLAIKKQIRFSGKFCLRKLTKKDAWEIDTFLWYSRAEKSDLIKGIDNFLNRLGDITHSLGSLILGNFIFLIIWFCIFIFGCQNELINFILVLISWIVLIVLLICNYFKTKGSYEKIAKMVLIEEFRNSFYMTNIYLSNSQCKKPRKRSLLKICRLLYRFQNKKKSKNEK